MLPVEAELQSLVCLLHKMVALPGTAGSSSFLPSNTAKAMPPANATSGVPSPLKSAMVGGPPPCEKPQLPLGHSDGANVPLMSTPERRMTNFEAAVAS